jgi:hypothetical protein
MRLRQCGHAAASSSMSASRRRHAASPTSDPSGRRSRRDIKPVMPRAPCRSPVWNGLHSPGARCPSVPRLTFDAELFIAGALLRRRSTPARTRYCSIPSGNCPAMRCPRDESGVSTRQYCRSPRSSRRRTPRSCQHSPSQHPGQLRADAAGRWQPRRGEEPRRSQTGLVARGRPRAAPLL